MATAALIRYTPEEYLALERHAEFRSEYRDGLIVAMAGSTWRHNQIVLDFGAALRAALGDGPCRVALTDLRVKIADGRRYVYPDVVGVCGERRFEDGVLDTLLNPVMVAEVLSPTTELYDRGDKFASYRTIETLREYVLIASEQVRVERYTRHGDIWQLSVFEDSAATLSLESLGCEVSLREMYRALDDEPGSAG